MHFPRVLFLIGINVADKQSTQWPFVPYLIFFPLSFENQPKDSMPCKSELLDVMCDAGVINFKSLGCGTVWFFPYQLPEALVYSTAADNSLVPGGREGREGAGWTPKI